MNGIVNEGRERILAPIGDDYLKMQLHLDKLQKVQWIRDLAPWQLMNTLTFRWEASLWSTKRAFDRFMNKKCPRASYFMSVERNPSRDGHHLHSLWADVGGVYRKDVWAAWFGKFGRARIEPVRDENDACAYASKYLCKAPEEAWWDVKLQWHRVQALNNSQFALRND
jgi:hypothetical protein